MPRPMLLIKEPVLKELYSKYKDGVPISRLIRDHKLNVTHPTLARLISYIEKRDETEDLRVKHIIKESLFPEWLDEEEDDIVKQPSEHIYRGKMPLGKWELRE